MSRFPIAEAIRSGVAPLPPGWWPKDDPTLSLPFREMLSECAFFDFQTAADVYWHGKKSRYELGVDFGPLTPPYEHMWIEWTVPDAEFLHTSSTEILAKLEATGDKDLADEYREMVDGSPDDKLDDLTNLIGTRMAVLLVSERVEDGWRLGFTLFLVPKFTGEVSVSPLVTCVDLDSEGGYVQGSHCAKGNRAAITRAKERYPDRLKSLAHCDENVVWMGLSLMNCRNVTVWDTGVAFGRTGREKRQRVPATRYNTIVLPGMEAARGHSRGGARVRDEIVMAQHRVRGHFKTYTAERPLLGKHVGTYWWGWQVRGSKGLGEVKSTYKIKETL